MTNPTSGISRRRFLQIVLATGAGAAALGVSNLIRRDRPLVVGPAISRLQGIDQLSAKFLWNRHQGFPARSAEADSSEEARDGCPY